MNQPTTISLPFTQEDFEKAADEWNCNCGPSALAAALDVSLDSARELIPGFGKKGYTSPTMMLKALEESGVEDLEDLFVIKGIPARFASWPERGLVRIQWCGPWTEKGSNPRWAYRYTHWIASFGPGQVFDCNGGMRTRESWETEIAPLLADFPRSYGSWYATHLVELVK